MLATTLGRKGLYLEIGWSTWKVKMGQPKGTAAEKICLENLLDRNSEFCMTWLWFCKGKDLRSLIIFPSAADYERFFFTKGSLCLMKIEMGTSGEAELEWVPSVVPVIRRQNQPQPTSFSLWSTLFNKPVKGLSYDHPRKNFVTTFIKLLLIWAKASNSAP